MDVLLACRRRSFRARKIEGVKVLHTHGHVIPSPPRIYREIGTQYRPLFGVLNPLDLGSPGWLKAPIPYIYLRARVKKKKSEMQLLLKGQNPYKRRCRDPFWPLLGPF